MIPGKRFNPATETSRRPTPEKFTHLRKWVDVEEQSIEIGNISELTNVEEILQQFSNSYISNIIDLTISALSAAYDDGLVSLQATEDGYLKVEDQEGADVKRAVINVATAANHTIVTAVTGKKIALRAYALTAAGDVDLTWKSGTTAISGAMDFGGTDEPRGISHGLGKYPLETTAGEALILTSSAAVQVSGYITYTEE